MIASPLAGVRSHQLSNGLKVFLKEDHRWPLVSLHAWMRVGSIDERESEAGISHVIEHMVFKGTTHYQAIDIPQWVESMGGALNAETSKEYTHYYIDVPRIGTREAIRVLSEMLCRATFDAAEWQRECPVVLEEIKRRNDDPDVKVWDLLNEAVFQEPQHRRPVIGSPVTVQAMDRDTLMAFYRNRYTISNCVIVLSGDFDNQKATAWLQEGFEPMLSGSSVEKRPEHTLPSTPRHLTGHKLVQQSYVALGFQTPPASHPDHEALDLIASILGDGRMSRLVRRLREEKKMVWSISASNFTHSGPGLFAVFAECDPQKRRLLPSALADQFARLRRNPPSEEEITRAKNLIQTAWMQSLETYHSQAALIGSFALDNHLDRLRAYMPKLLRLSRRQVSEVIDRYFSQPMASAVVES